MSNEVKLCVQHHANAPGSARFFAAWTSLMLFAGQTGWGANAAEGNESPEARRAAIPIASLKRKTPVDFEKEILPILKNNCLACHNKTTTKADLVLETPAEILKGGESGRAVVPGHSEESLLLQVASHQIKPRMPPKENKVAANDLTPDELGLIKLWIDQGATGSVSVARPVEWQPLPEGLNPIHAVALAADGQFAACSRANQIFIYHLPSGQFITRLTDPQLLKSEPAGRPGVAHRDFVHALAFDPDGDLLASGGYREVKLWQRARGAEKFRIAAADRQLVEAITVSPDGKWLATGGADREVKLWNAATGKRAKTFSGHRAAIRCVRFSPDGSRLASASADRTIRVWDLAQGKTIFQATTPSDVNAVAWLGKRGQIVSGHADFLIRAWQLDSVKREMILTREFKGHEGPVTSLAAMPLNPAQFVSGSGDGLVRIWNLEESAPVRQMKHGGLVTAVAVRPDGKRIASAGFDRQAKLWDGEKGDLIATLKGDRYARELLEQRERVLTLATNELAYRQGVLHSAQTNLAASLERVKKATEASAAALKASAEKEAKLKEATDGKAVAEKAVADFEAVSKKVIEAFAEAEKASATAEAELKKAKEKTPADSANETKLAEQVTAKTNALAQARAVLEKLPPETREKFKQLTEKLDAARKAQASAEAEFKKTQQPKANAENELNLAARASEQATNTLAEAEAVIPTAERSLRDAEEARQQAKERSVASEQPIRAVAFSPDNLTLATAGDDQLLHTWSAENGAAFETFPAERGAILSLAFLGNDALACGAADRTIRLQDLRPAWTLTRVIGTGGIDSPLIDRVNTVRFSPDGKFLATGGGEPSRSGEIKLWEVATGKLAQSFTNVHSDAVFALDFSPDGKLLASGAADKFAKVIDLASGKVVRTFEGHTHHVLSVAWKADGRTLVSAGADNMVKVWDFVTGERKKNIEGFGKEVTSIGFIGITDQALATSGDAKVRVVKMSGDEVRSFSGPTDFMFSAAATPDGRLVIAGGEDSILRVWNGTNGEVLKTFPAPAAAKTAQATQASR
ncbi:MAG: hypothetical protein HY043_23770 [Verrucomicrobia bacterium]|nr:hypothetical protein [Verrucomicrobiota bacterium]